MKLNELRSIRKSLNLTLRDVEEITSISNAYLSQLETGKIKNPSHNTMQTLSSLYKQDNIGWPDKATAKKLLIIRDELVNGNTHEAYHQLCLIADPKLESLNHWKTLESIAGMD